MAGFHRVSRRRKSSESSCPWAPALGARVFPCSFAACFRFADSPCSFVTCFIFVPSVALVFGIGFAFVFFCVVVCGYIGPKFGCADSMSGTPVSCREVATILGIQIVGLLGVATSQRFRYLAQVSPPHKI